METKSLGFIVAPLMSLFFLSNTYIILKFSELSFSLAIFGFLDVSSSVVDVIYI
jgi:hypothetical protein